MSDFHELSARQLVREMRAGAIGVCELVRAYRERILMYDGALRSVAALADDALAQAETLQTRGNRALPLYGLPVLIKDNIDVRGMQTTAGSLALLGNVAKHDAPVVANLRARGAVILGKTNMTELANYVSDNMPAGFSARGGQVKCAYRGDADPSGSSTGSAVAVSAGFCAAAVGTDTSFSVVGCATVHGVAGLKPPHGALDAAGIVPISATLDSAGALAQDFSDALLLYRGMGGTPLPDAAPISPERLRLAVNIFGRDTVSEAQRAQYDGLFSALADAGATIREVSHEYSPCQKTIMRCEFARDMERYLAASEAPVRTFSALADAYARSSAQYGYNYITEALASSETDAVYTDALRQREAASARLRQSLADFDACVMTGPTNIMHFTGLPSLALPLCMGQDGTPRGIILYGADESRLYNAALTVEAFCPWVRHGERRAPVLHGLG